MEAETLSQEQHLQLVAERAEAFLQAVSAASEAGVSQALILPLLLEILQASGIAP